MKNIEDINKAAVSKIKKLQILVQVTQLRLE